MYSDDKKTQYKNSLDTSFARNKFVAVENNFRPFEILLNKDLSEFTKEDIVFAMNSLEWKTVVPETIRQYLNQVEGYQRFVTGSAQSVTREDIDIVSVMQKCYFTDFSDVANPVDSVMPSHQGFPEVPALALAWLGFDSSNACKIKRDDVDLRNGVIQYGGVVKSFGSTEKRVLSALRSYSNMITGYRKQNPLNGDLIIKFVDSEYFLRPVRSPNSRKQKTCFTGTDIVSKLIATQEKLKEQSCTRCFTYRTVLCSGELHRVFLLEQSGVDVFSSRNERLLCSCFVSKTRGYDARFLYRNYKKAFDL